MAKVDGTIQELGFFTTRAACGHGPTQAEEAIRRKLAEELRLKLLNSQDDPPEIVFGEFTEIDSKTARSIPQSAHKPHLRLTRCMQISLPT